MVQKVCCSTGVSSVNKLLMLLIADSDEKEDSTARIIF